MQGAPRGGPPFEADILTFESGNDFIEPAQLIRGHPVVFRFFIFPVILVVDYPAVLISIDGRRMGSRSCCSSAATRSSTS